MRKTRATCEWVSVVASNADSFTRAEQVTVLQALGAQVTSGAQALFMKAARSVMHPTFHWLHWSASDLHVNSESHHRSRRRPSASTNLYAQYRLAASSTCKCLRPIGPCSAA